MRSDAIRQALVRNSGDSPGASDIARAAFDLWRQVAARLEPVVGARGVDVLFGRSVELTTKAFPWLAIAGAYGNSASSLERLQARFEGRETPVAADACYALLATFTELLAGLIGESLTERLLGVVWIASHSPLQQKRPA